MTEQQWDKKLKIHTIGRDDSHEDEHHYPYEPTPYSVLTRLAESGYINRKNIVIDYGCGKGRVGFFLNYELCCHTIGLEYDEKIYQQALRNQDTFVRRQGVEFACANAEEYEIENADCFYFFNPFSVEILRSVIGQIRDSYYQNPREIKLFFYYPNDEYLSYLMTEDLLMFEDEIDCRDLFEGENEREKILIFEVG
ncbi:MAG: class I SAM-dependent methyltransferase [Ruminococcus sp.]|nr:class I SAM-dependent methyltransferase [Ruminococcus sp.]